LTGRAGVSGGQAVVTVPSAQVIVTDAAGTEAATATVGRISAAAPAPISPDAVGERPPCRLRRLKAWCLLPLLLAGVLMGAAMGIFVPRA
jgi:hypothetical protein